MAGRGAIGVGAAVIYLQPFHCLAIFVSATFVPARADFAAAAAQFANPPADFAPRIHCFNLVTGSVTLNEKLKEKVSA